MKIIAVTNQKGGVGKTTTAVNLSSCLAEAGKRVLLCDLDPQGNATTGCGLAKNDRETSAYTVLIGESELAESICKTEFERLSVLPSTMDLTGAEIELVDVSRRESILKDALKRVESDYDYVIIDCPPSLSLLTLNALVAADTVLIPVQCEFYALEGLSQLTATIRSVRRLYNSKLDIEGILITMFDGRLNLTVQVLSEIKRFFPGKVFKTMVPRNVRLSEAPSYGQPVNHYDKTAKGTVAYRDLAKEILKKNK